MRGARDDNLGAVIATHGVERYCPRQCHLAIFNLSNELGLMI